MALPFTTTQETFDTVGERESLSDLIYSISPTETPFLMMAGRETATAVFEEWQMDALAAAAHNADPEGLLIASADVDAVVPTIRLGMPTQISTKSISVTGTIEVTNKAGRNSELSYQLAKKSKELKRDIEHCNIGENNASVKSAASGTARESASVGTIFHADTTQAGVTLAGIHIDRGTSGTDGGWDDSTVFDAVTDGTQRPLLESQLKGVIQGAWTNGGDPSLIMVGPFNKTVISGFTGNSTRFDRGEDKRLVAAIDVYVSDFGEHRVVPNRFQRDRDLYAFTPELWAIAYLRPFRQHALAKLGDSEDRTLLAEWCLIAKNHAGSATVADLTTS